VIPLITSDCIRRDSLRCGPLRPRLDGPSFGDGPYGPLTLAYMDQAIRLLDFEGRRLAYSAYGEGPPIVFGPRWVSHLEEGMGRPAAENLLRRGGPDTPRDSLRQSRLRALVT